MYIKKNLTAKQVHILIHIFLSYVDQTLVCMAKGVHTFKGVDPRGLGHVNQY